MNRITHFLSLTGLGVVFSLSACKKKKEDDHSHGPTPSSPSTRWVELGHGHSADDEYHVDLYAELPTGRDSLWEGYNRFRVRIRRGQTGSVYAGTDVRLWPMMYMMGHSHSCPVEQISGGPNAEGFYEGAAFFQMPTTVVNGQVTEPWKMHVLIGNQDTATIEIRVNPHPNGWVRRKRFQPADVRLLYEMRPARLATGSQDVTFYVYQRNTSLPHEDPNGFPATTDLRVHLKTWMPSMGHGAEGTQDALPVSGKPGHYAGKLGFNMTGDWEVYAAFIRGNDTLGRDTFRLNF
ncbi:MAG: FixH family protein [Bacteroidia bacterium]|nr:FixH family protein [Bacteroidia bacterium]